MHKTAIYLEKRHENICDGNEMNYDSDLYWFYGYQTFWTKCFISFLFQHLHMIHKTKWK